MNLCCKDHEEICYEGGIYTKCPVCQIIQEKDDEIEVLQQEVESLNQQVTDLENQEE